LEEHAVSTFRVDPEDGSIIFLWKVGKLLPDYMMSHLQRQWSSKVILYIVFVTVKQINLQYP
jgi:hypothetical protein